MLSILCYKRISLVRYMQMLHTELLQLRKYKQG
jgi:hypothetical protein